MQLSLEDERRWLMILCQLQQTRIAAIQLPVSPPSA